VGFVAVLGRLFLVWGGYGGVCPTRYLVFLFVEFSFRTSDPFFRCPFELAKIEIDVFMRFSPVMPAFFFLSPVHLFPLSTCPLLVSVFRYFFSLNWGASQFCPLYNPRFFFWCLPPSPFSPHRVPFPAGGGIDCFLVSLPPNSKWLRRAQGHCKGAEKPSWLFLVALFHNGRCLRWEDWYIFF